MNITVIKEDIPLESSLLIGGECAKCDLEITVDKHLPLREQQMLVIHSIIENYCQSWPHDKVNELEDLIREGLDQLQGETIP